MLESGANIYFRVINFKHFTKRAKLATCTKLWYCLMKLIKAYHPHVPVRGIDNIVSIWIVCYCITDCSILPDVH